MPLDWQRLKQTLAAALEISSPAARADFVQRACGDDISLRAELDCLLKLNGMAGDFLEKPAFPLGLRDVVSEARLGEEESVPNGLLYWSGGTPHGGDCNAALIKEISQLCQRYWTSVYVYLRATGHESCRARDLTQRFWDHLVSAPLTQSADQQHGFRSFLLKALTKFLLDDGAPSRSESGNAERLDLSLDQTSLEDRYFTSKPSRANAELLYTQRWALAALDHALERLQLEESGAGRALEFAQLEAFLTRGINEADSHTLEADLKMTRESAETAVRGLRGRFKKALRAEIAATVTGSAQVDEELQCLLAALRQKCEGRSA